MEDSGPPLPLPAGQDWEQFLEQHKGSAHPAVDLTALKAGDRLIVKTKNTRYELTWQLGGAVELTSDQPNRPYGPIKIEGCVFGQAGVVMPGVLFCGGHLEYHSEHGRRRHRTTIIRELRLVQHEG